MRGKKGAKGCCGPASGSGGAACSVEAIVTVDERGQMVLPKELREKAGIRAGEKFALAAWNKDGEVCCLTLVRAGDLVDMMKKRLGPVLAGALGD